MRFAVASKSGTEVDQHFGHAERFLIFETGPEGSRLVEEVRVDKYCSFDPQSPFRHRQFDAIADALRGCAAVVTAMIGQYPKEELKKSGIEAISATGTIEQALALAFERLDKSGR